MPDSTTYLVNELFLTIQGEATFAGTPAVFVRLQGCSVGCQFCDTKYTWPRDPGDQRPRGLVLAKVEPEATYATYGAEDLADQVVAMRSGARHVVFTGGEPADYDLGPVSRLLKRRGFKVQVETSGTSPLSVDDDAWVTLSPKIGMPSGKEVLRSVVERADEIKHPTATEKHLGQLQQLLAKLWHRPATPVWLQPLSQHPIATARCVAWCLEHGYRLSVQTHKYVGQR